MAIWPFNRNKEASAEVPQEVQDYYQAENRERSWVAWLLATGTLLVTVVVVLGLFYGGRWGYRKLKHQPKTPTVAVQTEKSQPQSPAPAATPPNNPQPAPTAAPAPKPTPTTPQTSSTSTAASNPTAAKSAAIPAATSSNLPNTGPGNTLAVFLAVSALAYMLHRKYAASH